MKKRILAALLSAVMVFTMIPFMGVTAYAENTKGPGDEYVSLPITIRDYAADGMLFDWNDMEHTGDFTKEISAGNTTWTNKTYSYDNQNDGWHAKTNWVSVYTSGHKIDSFVYWHCIVCNSSNGTVKRIIASGTDKNYTVQSGEF